MSGIWGRKIKLSIFGESHGKAIGITIDGLPPGFELDLDFIKKELNRRAPGKNFFSTSRAEEDEFEILSGFFKGRTTGTPFCAVIKNKNTRSEDYEQGLIRPGHADYTGYIRYGGFNDYRGGGHFSGRLTSPLVFAGAVAKQLLGSKDIIIGSHIKSIGGIEDEAFDMVEIDLAKLEKLDRDFPVLDQRKGEKMKEAILSVREEGDSLGGIVECAIINCPAGLGDPFFDSVESSLSQMLFSIPAVKGVEFGLGFELGRMKGSAANDEFYFQDGRVMTYTNNNGGILGGITNGMPIVFRVVFKPTPSIAKPQRTVNIKEGTNTTIRIKGRHDPCIVPRAVPVVEAAAALVMLDLLAEELGKEW